MDKCNKCDWVWSEDHPVHTHSGFPMYAVMSRGEDPVYGTYPTFKEAMQQCAKLNRNEPYAKYWVENWS